MVGQSPQLRDPGTPHVCPANITAPLPRSPGMPWKCRAQMHLQRPAWPQSSLPKALASPAHPLLGTIP